MSQEVRGRGFFRVQTRTFIGALVIKMLPRENVPRRQFKEIMPQPTGCVSWSRGSSKRAIRGGQHTKQLRQGRQSVDDQSLRQLGSPIAIFKPRRGNLVAGFILVVLMMIGSIVLIGISWRGQNPPRSPVGFIIIALLLFSGAVAIMIWHIRLSTLSVHVFSNGFVLCYRGKVEVFYWWHVVEVQQCLISDGNPSTGWKYIIKRSDGYEFSFDASRIHLHDRLWELTRAEILARGIPFTILDPDSPNRRGFWGGW